MSSNHGLFTFIVLVTLMLAPAASAATRTIAVLPLTRGAGGPELEGLGSALADMVVTDLSAVPGLVLVERQRLSDVLSELELAETEFIDESSAQEMGRGLGAEMVVVGSFTALEGQLVIDVRLVAVATGVVVKAARSEGVLSDFVSIEKDVVEGLVEGLEVELSRSEQRLLLLQAPTEDFEAFASYGRGIKARQDGDLDAARAALEEALQRDPEFARASEELASLAARIQDAQTHERARAADARTATLYGALEQLPAETTRDPGFEDTRESLMDLSLRLYLLSRSEQHCQRYEEMMHLLERHEGMTRDWWSDLPAEDPRERFEKAEEMIEARAAELGLTGEETWFGTRSGEVMRRAGMELGPAAELLVARNLKPEAFSESLVYTMERCFPPETRMARWDEMHRRADAWGVLDDPLYKKYGGGEVTVTPRDSVELYAALQRATHVGVDAQVTRTTEGVLARHPEGDPDRSSVLGRIREVVDAGAARERRIAGQLGMPRAALVGAAQAVKARDAALIRMDVPMCAAMVERSEGQVDNALGRYEELLANDDERRRLDAGVGLGGLLAPLVLARCFAGDEEPLAPAEVYPAIREALDRRHPAKIEDEACADAIEEVGKYVNEDAEAQLLSYNEDMQGHVVMGMLYQLYSLHSRRCLVP